MTTSLNAILASIAAYLGLGLVFGAVFVARGISAVDPAARGASCGFRLVVLPGVAALWPLMLWRWRRASRRAVGVVGEVGG
ncbi:MAG: hypothetical protein IT431_06140 [Phycisphaerales bacterium]|nr:hypothetical protein [Phycisphaerales bacterium]